MTAAREAMMAEEPSWDGDAKGLLALTMQRESLLVLLYFWLWQTHAGGLTGEGEPEPGKARGIASRLSLLGDLIALAPSNKDYQHQVEAAADATLDQARSLFALLAYGHLSELMPDVRRENYLVSGVSANVVSSPLTGIDRDLNVYDLEYPSASWAATEALDIALGAVGMPLAPSAPRATSEEVRRAMLDARNGDLSTGAELVARFAAHFRREVREVGILSDGALAAAFDMNADSFGRFRAALIGLGEWGAQSATWLQREMRVKGETEDLVSELMSWVAMNVDEQWLVRILVGVSGVPADGVRTLLRLFTFDVSDRGNTGDGFMPPLARIGRRLVFSPLILQTSLSDRNIAYALNAVDRTLFADMISSELEPKLLGDLRQVLAVDAELEIVTGVQWSSDGHRGEIDALVARAGDPCVLHIQAKGAIPPVGSRSVRHVETRVREGLQQCRSFGTLAQDEQARIVSAALNRTVENMSVQPIVLVRTNVGTHKIWTEAAAQETLLATLPLMRATFRAQVQRNGRATLSQFSNDVATCLSDLRDRLKISVRQEFVDLHWVGVNIPAIEMDEGVLMHVAAEWA